MLPGILLDRRPRHGPTGHGRSIRRRHRQNGSRRRAQASAAATTPGAAATTTAATARAASSGSSSSTHDCRATHEPRTDAINKVSQMRASSNTDNDRTRPSRPTPQNQQAQVYVEAPLHRQRSTARVVRGTSTKQQAGKICSLHFRVRPAPPQVRPSRSQPTVWTGHSSSRRVSPSCLPSARASRTSSNSFTTVRQQQQLTQS